MVKFAGLPVPGATVTATMGDKKLVAITDAERACTRSPTCPRACGTMQVEMLCFTPLKMEVASAANAPSPEWELKLLPFDEIKGSAPPPATLPTAPAATAGIPATAVPASPTPAIKAASTAASHRPPSRMAKPPKKGSKAAAGGRDCR